MPNHYNFSSLSDIKEIRVNPSNWVNPLIVEYAIGNNISGLSYFWRVKGTKHTFTISMQQMNYLSEGNRGQHFAKALESFRDDYISWKEYEEQPEWVREYQDEYKRFIL